MKLNTCEAMETINNYALQIKTQMDFDAAIEKVTGLLKQEGFGVLTEIDVQATLKKKLDIDWSPYRILGACNPPFAHEALEAVPQVGVLLPCNVVVWDQGEQRLVIAMDPLVMSHIVDHPQVKAVADEVSARIRRVLERLEGDES